MSGTYFEEKAERYLAARGAVEKPRELRCDLARWLEEMFDEGVYQGSSRIRDEADRAARDIQRFVAEVDRMIREKGAK